MFGCAELVWMHISHLTPFSRLEHAGCVQLPRCGKTLQPTVLMLVKLPLFCLFFCSRSGFTVNEFGRPMKILIIEDNPDILANLYDFLEPLRHVLDRARRRERLFPRHLWRI